MQAMRKDFLQSDTCSKCGEEVLKELIISGRLQQFEADNFISAGMAELADAPDLGSGVPDVQVQVLLPAQQKSPVLQGLLCIWQGLVAFCAAEPCQSYFTDYLLNVPFSK